MAKRLTDQKDVEKKDQKSVLPFVTDRSYWAPESAKDYFTEEVIGGYYAIKYLELLKSGGRDLIVHGLGRIIGDMVKAGKYGSIEIAFISSIDDVLKFYGIADLESYRRWKDSQIISMLKMRLLPKASKLRILDFMARTEREDRKEKERHRDSIKRTLTG